MSFSSQSLGPLIDYQQPTTTFSGLILVGEAPGAEEVRQGRPFCGRSGKLLDEVLAAAGVSRESLLIANVFRYQPPKNKVDYFFSSKRAAVAEGVALDESYGKFGAGYVRAEFAPELAALRDTITRVKPRAVVTVGRTPLWALTGQVTLGPLRGQWQANRLVSGVPVMPTFHPSFIIRGNWAQKDLMIADIAAAAAYPAPAAAVVAA